jgi:hypothetical protein
MKKHGWSGRLAMIGMALCGLIGLAAIRVPAQDQPKDKSGVNVTITNKDGSDAGLVIKAQATAKEVGLPIYPGAKPSKEDGDGSAAANLGLWGSSFGFKLVVLKMASGDSPEKVSAFYQKELRKYGPVLNCSDPSKMSDKDKSDSSKKLTCGDDKPDAGGLLFKAGSKEKQHIVSVKPNGSGCIFHMVYLEARDDSEKTPA